jgi:hypothetical protein
MMFDDYINAAHRALRKPSHADMSDERTTETRRKGKTATVLHKLNGHTYVWRYQDNKLPQALVTVPLLAAHYYPFMELDSHMVCRAMIEERQRWERAKNANGV